MAGGTRSEVRGAVGDGLVELSYVAFGRWRYMVSTHIKITGSEGSTGWVGSNGPHHCFDSLLGLVYVAKLQVRDRQTNRQMETQGARGRHRTLLDSSRWRGCGRAK